MSTENLSSDKIIFRLRKAVGVDNDVKLAKLLGYKSTGTISQWRTGNVPDGVISKISQISGKSFDELKYGNLPTVQESNTNYGSPYIRQVMTMMADMDEEMQKDICLSVEKEKLLRDLLRQKESKEKAG